MARNGVAGNVPQLISEIHVRVTAEELESLRQMGAAQQAPLSSVVRACLRHFVIEWRAGREVSAQLGAVTWRAEERK